MGGKTFLERGRGGVLTLEDPCCQYGAFPALSREQTMESCLSRNNGNVQQKKLKVVSREDNVKKRGGWRTRGQLGMQRMLISSLLRCQHFKKYQLNKHHQKSIIIIIITTLLPLSSPGMTTTPMNSHFFQ